MDRIFEDDRLGIGNTPLVRLNVHHATTAVAPAARTEMTARLEGPPGNTSRLHAHGQQARRTIGRARARLARLVGAQPEQVVDAVERVARVVAALRGGGR